MFVKRDSIKDYYTGNSFEMGISEGELIDRIYSNYYSVVLYITKLNSQLPVYNAIPIVNNGFNYCFSIPIKFMGLSVDTKTGLMNKKYKTLKDMEKEVKKELKKYNLTLISLEVAYFHPEDSGESVLYQHTFYEFRHDSY